MPEISPDPLHEETVGSERIYEGQIVNLRRDTVRMPEGHEATREVVEHPGAVVVLAYDDEGHIPFVRQWRVPVGGPLLELPAGGIDPGEEPAAAAARELQEEVGLKPGSLEQVAAFWAAPGWADEYLYGYVARDCTASQLSPDADEKLEVHRHTLGEAMELVEQGVIADSKSILLLQHSALRAAGPLVNKIVRHYRGE